MRNTRTYIGWLVTVAALHAVASAQEAPTASEVAGWVQTFLSRSDRLEARFQQDFWSSIYGSQRSARGQLRVARPGRLRLDYTTPEGQIAAAHDADYVFFQRVEGTAGQFHRGSSELIGEAFGFLTGHADVTRDYTLSIVASSHAPEGTIALELVPRAASPVHRLRLYVSRDEAHRGEVRQLAIEDAQGGWNTFRFLEWSASPTFAPTDLDFTVPSGAREMAR
jgi:outer membrane lipoprotein-sorting protein